MISKFAMAMVSLTVPSLVAAQPAPDQAAPKTVSLSLEEAVEIGLQRSFRVQRSNRNEQIAGHRVEIARAQNRPRFELGLGASQNQSYYDFQGNAFSFNRAEPQFYADAQASASLPIDISGVTRRQVRQARYAHQSSELDRNQAALEVATDIRGSYTTALRSQKQVAADEAYLARIQTLLERARTSQPSVVNFLETELGNAAQTLESTRTTAELSLQSLRLLAHVPRETKMNLTSELPPPPPVPSTDLLLEVAARNRVDLAQSAIRLEQARLANVQASDSRRPSLRVTAYGSQRFNGDTPFFNGDNGRTRSGGLVITGSVPIIVVDGGQLKNQRHITAIQAEQALADRAEASERAENEINQVLIGLNRAKQRMSSLPDVEQARLDLERIEGLMLSAGADAPGLVAQVTNARQNWRSAVIARNDALADFYTSYFRLQRAIGSENLDGV